MASCHNSLGEYGILPYPLRPLNILKGCSGLRCTNRDSIAIFPQVSWEFGCVSSPTEFTEVRLRKSSHRFHRFAQMAWLRLFSHGFHRSTQMVGCVCSPTEFTEFTEVWGAVGCVGMAGCHTLLHLCKSVPICGRYFSARRFRVFRAFCGNIVSHGFHSKFAEEYDAVA